MKQPLPLMAGDPVYQEGLGLGWVLKSPYDSFPPNLHQHPTRYFVNFEGIGKTVTMFGNLILMVYLECGGCDEKKAHMPDDYLCIWCRGLTNKPS